MTRRWFAIISMAGVFGTVATVALTASQGQVAPAPVPVAKPGDGTPATRAAREEQAIQEARRQQLAEKEAALAAKEEELKKLGAKLDAQIKALEEAKKQHELMVKTEEDRRKQAHGENVTKMVRLFKTLEPAQAADMLDSMEEAEVKLVLDRLEVKVVARLVPNLNKPRTIRWVNENLRKRGEK